MTVAHSWISANDHTRRQFQENIIENLYHKADLNEFMEWAK